MSPENSLKDVESFLLFQDKTETKYGCEDQQSDMDIYQLLTSDFFRVG